MRKTWLLKKCCLYLKIINFEDVFYTIFLWIERKWPKFHLHILEWKLNFLKKNIAVKLDFYLWFSSTILKVFFVALKFKTQIQFVAFQRFSGLWRAAHHVSCGPRLHYSRKNFQKFLHPLTDRDTSKTHSTFLRKKTSSKNSLCLLIITWIAN